MNAPKDSVPARRQLHIGFNREKSAEGEVIGASTVRLRRRNAYEMIGLHRPSPQNQLRIKPER